MNKQVAQLVERIERVPGARVDTAPNHPRVYMNGVFVTALPSTPSKPSWYQNALAALKRGGIDVQAKIREPNKAQTPQLNMKQPSVKEIRAEGSRKAALSAGRMITREANEALRVELKIFLEQRFGYPKRGSFTRFAEYAFAVGQQSDTVDGYKTPQSASVSLNNFLNDRNGISEARAAYLREVMRSHRAGEKIKVTPFTKEVLKPEKGKKKAGQLTIKPEPQPEPVVQPVAQPVERLVNLGNGTLEAFIDIVEGRTLTKAELLEALVLAEMQAEFTSAHPRA